MTLNYFTGQIIFSFLKTLKKKLHWEILFDVSVREKNQKFKIKFKI